MTSVCTASNCGGCGTKTLWSSVLFEQYATKAFAWVAAPDRLADIDDVAPEDVSFVVIVVPVFRAVTVCRIQDALNRIVEQTNEIRTRDR